MVLLMHTLKLLSKQGGCCVNGLAAEHTVTLLKSGHNAEKTVQLLCKWSFC